MPVQHSPPAKNTISQRHQAVLTPSARAPPDCTPSVHQLSVNLDRGPPMEGAAPYRRGGVKSRRSRSFSGCEDHSYLLNNWQLFETKLFTLFGDPNEVRKAEQELENLRMKESGQLSLYIADVRGLMSRIGDWGGRAYIHVYRRGLASRLLDLLASHPGKFDSLQELMEITLELDNRYHERKKEKSSHQEKKPPISGANSSKPPQSSSSKKLYHRKKKEGNNFKVSKDKPHAALLTKDNKLTGSERERRIKEGLCNYFGGKPPFEKCFKRPENRQGSSKCFPTKQGKA
ncbi:hypothetical protein O181_123223 [Austropuccinia psidii MF-1]|uniref:Retrotransposon gag domain-containing protein n=1 Tax=Austropuccinia psidii MF-1 TaxID=1389203 RepID=A0A9Q3KLB0_9BASI|nr:hypothetical protein [Austropuccinia psidii MF-1]